MEEKVVSQAMMIAFAGYGIGSSQKCMPKQIGMNRRVSAEEACTCL